MSKINKEYQIPSIEELEELEEVNIDLVYAMQKFLETLSYTIIKDKDNYKTIH